LSKLQILVSLAFSLTCTIASALPANLLYYTGNGYVAGGRTDTISSDNGFRFSVNSFGTNAVEFFINDFATNPDFQHTQFFDLDLAAPAGTPLHVGVFSDATRYPFQAPSSPGLWFAANGRGDNQDTGFFDILEISFDGNELASLAVDFVQNDENGFLGQTSGRLRYNSTVPLFAVVPEPSTLALLALAVVCMVAFTRLSNYELIYASFRNAFWVPLPFESTSTTCGLYDSCRRQASMGRRSA
jgi:hypothetical protein